MSETNDAVCDALEGAYAANGNDISGAALALARDLVAARQQLADVAYLEAWAQGHPDRELSRWGLGVCVLDERDAMYKADSLPALGALLRQREEG